MLMILFEGKVFCAVGFYSFLFVKDTLLVFSLYFAHNFVNVISIGHQRRLNHGITHVAQGNLSSDFVVMVLQIDDTQALVLLLQHR